MVFVIFSQLCTAQLHSGVNRIWKLHDRTFYAHFHMINKNGVIIIFKKIKGNAIPVVKIWVKQIAVPPMYKSGKKSQLEKRGLISVLSV